MNRFLLKNVSVCKQKRNGDRDHSKNGVSSKNLIMSRIFHGIGLSLIALLTTTLMVNAQSINAQDLQFEGVVGLNSASMGEFDSKVGLHLGLRAETALPSLGEGVYGNAGALLSFKGTESFGKTYAANYLEIPVHIGYKHAVNEKFSIYGEAGPYLAFGLSGKSDLDITSALKVNTFGDEGLKLKRFDIGIGFRAGIESQKKYTLSVGYDLGLIDPVKGSYLEQMMAGTGVSYKANNSNLYLSAGYKF